ncbi:tetratricopeptide repeat protein [Thioclava sp. GXIMD4215]|uniref:tetratricopeptide repeat protein n=1 Tax=Thioclava sp. GXIMD4215 TaxID=3131928 RepID=UPI00311AF67D
MKAFAIDPPSRMLVRVLVPVFVPVLVSLTTPALADMRTPSDPTMRAAKTATDQGDLAQAVTLYKEAADQGQASAASELARLYLEGGTGLTPDYAAAADWAERAAQGGDSRGYLYLGKIYMDGLGVPVDTAKAKDYFHKGEAAGDMKAPRYLGLIAKAEGDDKTAATWFAEAAEAGDITSQFYLGQAYETGAGVPQDYTQALYWYRKSAARDDLIGSNGMVGEAGLYARGLGVAQDPARAKALYTKAAAFGNPKAQAALAALPDAASAP